eukprot:CAMPEP_0168831960 /NCGR_PEP_ID=MMETSP0727-20121128/2309_1 /TAXON_ID=265536 /ORGANISM="Amphiprora sp., Strain CCMP467" /LENGTH=461 /DNA_ID=CAMNT_0008885225 /DNA_START=21 /DNA_END=1406 /DNA_ORIENTATION=-
MAARETENAPTEWIGTGKDEDHIANEKLAFLATLTVDQSSRRGAGVYFSFMEDVWDNTATAPFNAADFESIRRSQSQGFVYQLCSKFIDTHEMAKGSRSATTNTNDNNLRIDAYGSSDCPSAHLLSHAEVCHKAFGILAEACVGKKVDDDFGVTTPDPKGAGVTTVAAVAPVAAVPVAAAVVEKRKRQPPERYTDSGPSKKKTKKQKTKEQIAEGRLKLWNGVSGKANTSLKGHKFNKMYFHQQETYYDTEHPSVLVIPLLSFKEIMDWGMQGHQTSYDVLTITFGEKRKRAGQLLTLVLDECRLDEIEQARALLETFVRGVAGSLLNKDIEQNFKESDYETNPSLKAWHQLVERVQNKSQPTIGIPGARQQPGSFHVAKSRLSRGNSLPDPWLVMIKAAINYSSFRKTKLMPACRPENIGDEEMNTTQGEELYVKDNVDHAAELALSLRRGGTSIEIFSA